LVAAAGFVRFALATPAGLEAAVAQDLVRRGLFAVEDYVAGGLFALF